MVTVSVTDSVIDMCIYIHNTHTYYIYRYTYVCVWGEGCFLFFFYEIVLLTLLLGCDRREGSTLLTMCCAVLDFCFCKFITRVFSDLFIIYRLLSVSSVAVTVSKQRTCQIITTIIEKLNLYYLVNSPVSTHTCMHMYILIYHCLSKLNYKINWPIPAFYFFTPHISRLLVVYFMPSFASQSLVKTKQKQK